MLHCRINYYFSFDISDISPANDIWRHYRARRIYAIGLIVLRVSGRSPESAATGAQRPSRRNTGCFERSDIHLASCPLPLGGKWNRFAMDLQQVGGRLAVALRQNHTCSAPKLHQVYM